MATTGAARVRLNQLADADWAIRDVVADLTDHLDQRVERLRAWTETDAPLDDVSVAFQRLQLELIEAEMAEAFRLRDSGRINDTTLRKIQRELDIERIRLDQI